MTRVTLTNLLRKFTRVAVVHPSFICRTSIVFHPRCNKRVIPCCSSIFTRAHTYIYAHIYTHATRNKDYVFSPTSSCPPSHSRLKHKRKVIERTVSRFHQNVFHNVFIKLYSYIYEEKKLLATFLDG